MKETRRFDECPALPLPSRRCADVIADGGSRRAAQRPQFDAEALIQRVKHGQEFIGGGSADKAAGTLEARAAALVSAVATGERGVAQSLTAGATSDALPDWVRRVRRTVAPLGNADSEQPHIKVILKNDEARIAVVKVVIPSAGPAAKNGTAKGQQPPARVARSPTGVKPAAPGKSAALEVVTYWTFDPSGGWLFDAKRTLAETPEP